MSDSFIIVDEDDWQKATMDRRSWMIWNTLKSLDNRIKNIEFQLKRNLFVEKVSSFAGGILGGALAVFAYIGLKMVI